MAGKSARNLYWNLDNAAGAPQDLSTLAKGLDLNDDVGEEDSTTFGSTRTAVETTVTLTSGGYSIRAPYSSTLWTHLAALKGLTATSTFIVGPEGSTAGMPRTAGECRLRNLKRSGEVTALLAIEAEFSYQGAITENTF